MHTQTTSNAHIRHMLAHTCMHTLTHAHIIIQNLYIVVT